MLRARTLFVLAALAMLGLYAGIEWVVIRADAAAYAAHPLAVRDFSNYWIAGRAILEGRVLELFHQPSHMGLLREAFGPDYPWHNWSYPPHFLFVCWPLGLLGYLPALALFLVATLAFFLWSARKALDALWPQEAAAIWRDPLFALMLAPFVLACLRFTQNGFLLSGLMLMAIAWWREKPWAAGVMLGLLTVKPQLGLLIPLALLADRNWRAIAGAGLTLVALVAASSLAFGLEAWRDYLTVAVPYQSTVLTSLGGGDRYLQMMLSAYAGARVLGLEGSAAWAVHAGFALPALGLCALGWRVARSDGERFAVLLIATFLVSPYGFNYDAGALAVLCAGLVLQRMGQGAAGDVAGDLDRRLLIAVAVLPVLGNLLALLVLPLAPAILLASLTVMVLRLVSRSSTAFRRAVSPVAASG